MTAGEAPQDEPYGRDDLNLTPRQAEVLKYLAQGCRNKEIAERMNLSPSTVKMHLSGLMTRLNVKTRTAAVVEAHRRHLI